MGLKNIRFARAENLSTDKREKFSLPDRGLVIIETHNPTLREEIVEIKEGGFREYLLSKGKFLEETPTSPQ